MSCLGWKRQQHSGVGFPILQDFGRFQRCLSWGRSHLVLIRNSVFVRRKSVSYEKTPFNWGRPWPMVFLVLLQIREACVHKTFLGGPEFVWVRWACWLFGASGERRSLLLERVLEWVLKLLSGSFLYYFVLHFHIDSSTWDQCSDFTRFGRPLEPDLASVGRLLNCCFLGP